MPFFVFNANGIVTYRDKFVYVTNRDALADRIRNWLNSPPEIAERQFKYSSANNAGRALAVLFDAAAIRRVSYRPPDIRHLYAHVNFVDRLRLHDIPVDCTTDPRGTDVGISSKHLIGTVRTNILATGDEGNAEFSRICLEFQIPADRGSLHRLADHFKRIFRGDVVGRGQVQAREMRRILTERCCNPK